MMWGWRHGKGKLHALLHGFRSLASRVVLQDSIFQPTSRICQSRYLNSGSKGASFDVFSSFSSISHRLGTRGVEVNTNCHNPFLAGTSRRFYHVDPYIVRHFRPREPRRWFQNPRNVYIVVVVGLAVFITVDFGRNLETVPYTNRTHWILPTIAQQERIGGERQFEELKVVFEREGKILPPTHPDSVRVTIIFNNIIDALQRGLKKMENVSPQHTMLHRIIPMSLLRMSKPKPSTLHLDGLNWEVLVVDYPDVACQCYPGGKIVLSTAMLHHFGSDAEIATIIGHEVAHVVARHSAERLTRTLWIFNIHYILNQFVTIDFANRMSFIIPRLPFNRRFEMEADYIGLLLMASADYDPQVAPKVYEELGKSEETDNDSMLRGYHSTHPPGRKRAKALAQAKIMKEALFLYKDVRAEHGVE